MRNNEPIGPTFLSAGNSRLMTGGRTSAVDWLLSAGERLRLAARRRFRRRITRILETGRRAGVARDERRLQKVASYLDIEWQARDLHPWDADLPRSRQAELFATHVLADTVAVVRRLFDALPEIDSLQISVLDPHEPRIVLAAGTISRESLRDVRDCRSPAMTLKLLGVCFALSDGVLQPLG